MNMMFGFSPAVLAAKAESPTINDPAARPAALRNSLLVCLIMFSCPYKTKAACIRVTSARHIWPPITQPPLPNARIGPENCPVAGTKTPSHPTRLQHPIPVPVCASAELNTPRISCQSAPAISFFPCPWQPVWLLWILCFSYPPCIRMSCTFYGPFNNCCGCEPSPKATALCKRACQQ